MGRALSHAAGPAWPTVSSFTAAKGLAHLAHGATFNTAAEAFISELDRRPASEGAFILPVIKSSGQGLALMLSRTLSWCISAELF